MILFSLGLFFYSYLLIPLLPEKKEEDVFCKGKGKWNSIFIMKGLWLDRQSTLKCHCDSTKNLWTKL